MMQASVCVIWSGQVWIVQNAVIVPTIARGMECATMEIAIVIRVTMAPAAIFTLVVYQVAVFLTATTTGCVRMGCASATQVGRETLVRRTLKKKREKNALRDMGSHATTMAYARMVNAHVKKAGTALLVTAL